MKIILRSLLLMLFILSSVLSFAGTQPPTLPLVVYGTAVQSGEVTAMADGVIIASTTTFKFENSLTNEIVYRLFIDVSTIKSQTVYILLNGTVCGWVSPALPGKVMELNLYPLLPYPIQPLKFRR